MPVPGLRLLAAMVMTPWLVAGADVPAATYQYAVLHPTFGEIGTFTNTVRADSGETTVHTAVRISVDALMVPLRRIVADRDEVWRDGRLVAYRSSTDHDGRMMKVEGHADGDRFVIDGPFGRTDAPAGVFPTDPWSIDITRARVVMGAETGRLYRVQFTEEPRQTISLAGHAVETRHFVATGDQQAQLWYDLQNIPVRFSIVQNGTNITFALKNMLPAQRAASAR